MGWGRRRTEYSELTLYGFRLVVRVVGTAEAVPCLSHSLVAASEQPRIELYLQPVNFILVIQVPQLEYEPFDFKYSLA